jgi:hypothetical protein
MVDEPNEDEDAVHPMDGRVWMFQCKRERTVGPKKIQSIIEDGVSALEPPYGYVLAAPANFPGSDGILSMGPSGLRGHASFAKERSNPVRFLWYLADYP